MAKIAQNEKQLLETAAKTTKNARVLWGFPVGAAVLAEDDKIYEGCNVESWTSGLGICAERCAIDHAVLHGNDKIKRVAVVIDNCSTNEPRPCGMCLQYISYFSDNPELKILMARTNNGKVLLETVKSKTILELLPFPYRK